MPLNMTVISKATRRDLSPAGLRKRGTAGLLALLLLSACSDDPPDGVITIKTGGEPDVWTVEPLAKNVFVELVEASRRTTLAAVPAPASSISIGTEGPSNVEARFVATAFDADSDLVLRGSTIPFFVRGIAGIDVPVFMGRTGGFSRAPDELLFPRRHPQLAFLSNSYLLASGGDGAQNPASFDVYDLVSWSLLTDPKTGEPAEQPPLPKVPESWATFDPKLLLIDHASATWLDLSTDRTSAVETPVGLDWAQIAGGKTISGPEETQYIVGATRLTGEPTNQVLRIDVEYNASNAQVISLHLMTLRTARLGAAAAIVNGQLLVVGGSDSDAGAEVSTTAGSFTPLPFPPDARQGAALLVLDETSAVLAGGRDPETDEISGFRTMDLGCTANCSQEEIANADFAFDYPQLFSLGENQLLAFGEDPTTEESHVFTFDTGLGHALNEFALRVPRTGAAAVMLPNGQVAVLGGNALAGDAPALSMELFFPAP